MEAIQETKETEASSSVNKDVADLASQVTALSVAEQPPKSQSSPAPAAAAQNDSTKTTLEGDEEEEGETDGETDEDESPVRTRAPHRLREISALRNIIVKRINADSSPLESAKRWEELQLPEDLVKGIYAKNFIHPSRIQGLALPLVLLSEENLVAQAQNGSGKTATFALCMLAKTTLSNPAPQSLCLSHTRELARQNMDVIRELGKFTKVKTWLAVPQGEYYDPNVGAQLVVGTPGKVREFLMKKKLPVKDVRLFVLDEADVMMDHNSNLGATIAQVRQALPKHIQILLFSATFPERVSRFVDAYVSHANRLEVRKEELTLATISQCYIECASDAEKFSVVSDLYGCLTVGQSVIFVNTRRLGFDLAQKMKDEGHAVSLICGTQGGAAGGGAEAASMDHESRERVMQEFRNGETKVLIATDVLARGIDVPQVTLVINYHLPMRYHEHNAVDMETYIHRIGRTGRFGLKGLAISLIKWDQLDLMKQIEGYYRCQISPLSKDPEKIEEMVKKLRSNV